MKKIYIIGNGFDLHHGYKTRYEDYKDYLNHTESSLKALYEDNSYFVEDIDTIDRWSDLERCMEIDYGSYFEEATNAYYPNLLDDNPGWDDLHIDTDVNFSFLERFTRNALCEWLKIQTSMPPQCLRNDIDCNALFLTFNYTHTLERYYHIEQGQILHIHGDMDIPSSIIFGSPENNPARIEEEMENWYARDDFYGAVYNLAVGSMAKYAGYAYKGYADCFEVLSEFIRQTEVEQVVVMGHRLCSIDDPYYENIIVPALKYKHWLFYNHDDIDGIESFISKYELSSTGITNW